MAWNPAIPQPTDLVSASQPLILNNFGELNTWSQVDHEPIDSGSATNGMHKHVRLPEQINNPVTAANIAALVSGQGPISALTELFFIPEGEAAGPLANRKPWTEFRVNTIGVNDGYFYVAGGRLIVLFNRIAAPGAAANSYTYNFLNIPALAGAPIVYTVPLTTADPGGLIATSTVDTNNVSFEYTTRAQVAGATFNVATAIYFLAIGVPA